MYFTEIIQSLSINTFVSKQVMAFFSEAFGLEVPEAVALLGAHTIGHMHRDGSGYTGAWKERGVTTELPPLTLTIPHNKKKHI